MGKNANVKVYSFDMLCVKMLSLANFGNFLLNLWDKMAENAC